MECIRALKNYTKKKSLRYKERDESKRAAFLLSIEEISPSDIVYFDESRIDSFVHKEFGWSVHGEKVMGEVSGKRFARESFVAGLYRKEILAPLCYSGTCNTSVRYYHPNSDQQVPDAR